MEATPRKRLTVSIPEYAMNDLKKKAELTGWSLSALAGEYILDAMYHEPNEETKAAIEEARSGADMEEVDMSSFENFKKSLGTHHELFGK